MGGSVSSACVDRARCTIPDVQDGVGGCQIESFNNKTISRFFDVYRFSISQAGGMEKLHTFPIKTLQGALKGVNYV